MYKNETNTNHFTVNDKEMTKQQASTVILGKKWLMIWVQKRQARGHSESNVQFLKVQKYLR